MADRYRPDFTLATAEMQELIKLADLWTFDLSIYLDLLRKVGLPVYRRKIDDEPTASADCCIVRYELGEGLRIILAALRAKDRDVNHIKLGSGGRRMPFSGSASPLHGVISR